MVSSEVGKYWRWSLRLVSAGGASEAGYDWCLVRLFTYGIVNVKVKVKVKSHLFHVDIN